VQIGRQVVLDGDGVGILFLSIDPTTPGMRRRNRLFHQPFSIPHRQTALDHLGRHRLGLGRGDQGAGVTRRQVTIAQQAQNRLGQGQQAHRVGNVAAAARQGSGELLLGMAKAVHQLAVGQRLLDSVQVGALDVFDDGDFQHFFIVIVPDQHRHLM
jgi:hypothetical protein